MGKIPNKQIKKITGVQKPAIVDIIERKRLQWYGSVKRMQEQRLPNLLWNGSQQKGRIKDDQRKHG